MSETVEEKLIHLKAYLTIWKINAIVPVKYTTYQFLCKYRKNITESLLPPLPNESLLQIVSNKLSLAEWLSRNSFASPKTYPVTIENIHKLEYPLLLKPKMDVSELQINVHEKKADLLKEIESDEFKPEKYILQELIVGDDIDISILAEDGEIIAYTIQKGLIRGDFSFSASIEFINNNRLFKITQEIIKQMNWSGIAHLDFIYNESTDMYYLLDFNARIWSTVLGSVHAGINFPVLLLKRILQQNFPLPSYQNIKFYLAKPALQNIKQDLLHAKLPNFKNTALQDIGKDPLPEIMKGFKQIASKVFPGD